MLGVWYPFDRFGPSTGIAWWVWCLFIAAFVLGCAVTMWLFRSR